MNPLDKWCRSLSLLCCLILGIEGLTFAHNTVIQARLISSTVAIKIEKPTHSLFAPGVTKVAVN